MGEAKRRKKALGERYGETPAVLMPGSEQLEEHSSKLAEAYFAKLDALHMSKGETDALQPEQVEQRPEEEDTSLQKMQLWVQDYLKPYRPKDREQLAIALLEPFYFVLFDASDEFFKSLPGDEQTEFIASLVGGLSSLSILASYLSRPKLDEYREPMRYLYWDMLDTIEEEANDAHDRNVQAEKLTQLFEVCLDEEDIPDYLRGERESA